jgi:hypothetical protein
LKLLHELFKGGGKSRNVAEQLNAARKRLSGKKTEDDRDYKLAQIRDMFSFLVVTYLFKNSRLDHLKFTFEDPREAASQAFDALKK